MPRGEFTYKAFLSYAHADGRWARWLHSSLEGFAIDKDLAGRATPRGPVPATLRPIFRDRDEFVSGHTLNDATIAALDGSAALIVLCSAVAATRPAVNEEVRLFRHRHPDRPVIPVIIGGVSPANFPPALRFALDATGAVTDQPVTILGTDLRDTEHADGQQLGLAKIIAGLTGIPVDDIYRRAERARRQQARRRLALASLVATLALGGGFFYWQGEQRGAVIAVKEQEANQALAIARQMLSANPAAASQPGQQQGLIDALKAIQQSAATGDADYTKAFELLKAGKAADAVPLLLAAADAKKRRAASENKAAAKAYREAAAIAAVAEPGRARELYAEAARLDPDDIEGLIQNGWFQAEAGQLAAAETAYQRVIATAKPGTDDRSIYWARLGLGDIQSARGDLSVAAASYRDTSAIADRLAKADPGNAGWQRDLSVSHNKVGDVLVAQGQLPQALDSFKASLAIADRLAKADPGNAGWQRDLSVSYDRVGGVLVAQGQLPQALDSFKASHEIFDRLAKADPGNAGWQADLAASHGKLGQLYLTLGNTAEAQRLFKAGRAIVAPFAERSSHQLWIGYLKSFDAEIAALEGK